MKTIRIRLDSPVSASIALIAVLLSGLPAPASAQAGAIAAPPSAIDAAQLMTDLRVLAADSMEGREVGTPGGQRARAYLLRRFDGIGLRPFGTGFEDRFSITRRGAESRTAANVIGYVAGTTRPNRYIVVTAHYDHVGIRDGEIFNGADDNASGTAALLALAAHFRASPAAHSIIFAALDAEEGGLRGARDFVADPPVPADSIVMNINMDMVARGDTGELWAAGTHHYPALRPLVEKLAETAPVKLRIGHDSPDLPQGQDWTTASDHGPFHAAGIPFLYFGVEDHVDYHKATDEADRIDAAFYADAVRTVLMAVRAVDASPPARS